MQLMLPIFPLDTRMISRCLGVYERDSIVQYIANGLPIYSHASEDLQSFRFITSNFINQGLCKSSEVSRCFGIPVDSVKRYLTKLRTEGEVAFFSGEKRKGYCHKIRGSVLENIQKKLDKGRSVNSIAKEEGLTEGSIRYSIKQGYLKKTKSTTRIR
jgi:predicted transcriptional regulator